MRRRRSPVVSTLASLLPLVPAAVEVWRRFPPSIGAVPLLGSVLLACLVGGLGAGIASAVLSAFLYHLVVLQPRFSIRLAERELTPLALFGLAALTILLAYGWLAHLTRRTERARLAAEDRNATLTQNISAEGRLRRELDRSVAQLSAVLDSSPHGFALLDTNLAFRRANDVLVRICGLTGPPAAGDGAEALGPLAGLTHADLAGVLQTGRPVVDRPGEQIGADGVRRYLLASAFPVRLPGGAVSGVAVQVIDETQRRKLAELESEAVRLRDTAELVFKLEAAQRLAGFASWEVDLRTGGVTWSEEMLRLLATEQPPVEVDQVRRFVHPDDAAEFDLDVARLADDGTPYVHELRMIRDDGEIIQVRSTGESVRDENGRPVVIWGTVQDITGLRATERAAEEASRRAEQARAALLVEHQALQLFQRAMLPRQIPRIQGMDLATAYLPVTDRVDVGGDWYDAFQLTDGRLVLAVGDVTGHDLRAASIMGQVRSAVRAYAVEDPSPGTLLRRVNRLLAGLTDLDLVTMLFGVYDLHTHTLSWSRAGHPAPVHRRGAEVTVLEEPAGVLLGALPDVPPYEEGKLRLEPGDAVLWYTDGLVDQRDVDPQAALKQMRDLIAGCAPDITAAELVELVPRGLMPPSGADDDICLLALRRLPVGRAAPG
jgi:PAS domain S-box-containing protein